MGPPKPASPNMRGELSHALVEHGDRLYALALRVTRDPDLAADALQEASQKLAEAVYAQAASQAASSAGNGGDGASASASDDEVVEEADYEVIDEEEAKQS